MDPAGRCRGPSCARPSPHSPRHSAPQGIVPGDRIAGYLPNLPEGVIGALAAAAVGAVWTSCSPDFGVQGVLDRFGQIEPQVLIAADGYCYGGKRFDCLAKVAAALEQLPSVLTTLDRAVYDSISRSRRRARRGAVG